MDRRVPRWDKQRSSPRINRVEYMAWYDLSSLSFTCVWCNGVDNKSPSMCPLAHLIVVFVVVVVVVVVTMGVHHSLTTIRRLSIVKIEIVIKEKSHVPLHLLSLSFGCSKSHEMVSTDLCNNDTPMYRKVAVLIMKICVCSSLDNVKH